LTGGVLVALLLALAMGGCARGRGPSEGSQAEAPPPATPPVIEVLALIGDGQKAIPPQLMALESLAPLRFELISTGYDANVVMHVIDGNSLFSNGQNKSWDQAREDMRRARLDAIRSERYAVLAVFGAGFDDETLAALGDARRSGRPFLAWSPDRGLLQALGAPCRGPTEAAPADPSPTVVAFANWDFETTATAGGVWAAQCSPQLPAGTAITALWEKDSRLELADRGHSGQHSLQLHFPGGQNGLVVRLGVLDLPADVDLHEVTVALKGWVAGSGSAAIRLVDLNSGREAGRLGTVAANSEPWQEFAVTGRLPQAVGNRLGLEAWMTSRGTLLFDDIRMTSVETLRTRAADMSALKATFGGSLPRWEQEEFHELSLPPLDWRALPGLLSTERNGWRPLIYSSWRDEVAAGGLDEGDAGRLLCLGAGRSPLLRKNAETSDALAWYRILGQLAGLETPPPPPVPGTQAPPTGLTITTEPEFTVPGHEVAITVAWPSPRTAAEGERLALELRDRSGRLLDRFEAAAESSPWRVAWRVPDTGPLGAYFRVRAELRNRAGVSAEATRSLYTARPFDPRERLIYATWSTVGAESDFVARAVKRLFEHAGIDTLTSRSGLDPERLGWFAQPEAGNGGVDTQFGWPTDSFEEIPQRMSAAFPYARSSACQMVSWGEEPGFGPAFGAAYWWEEGQAPASAVAWFRKYVRDLYNHDLVALNHAWQTDCASFDDVPFLKANTHGRGGTAPSLADGFRMIDKADPSVILEGAPERALPFIGKYLDTGGFFTWHFDGVVQAMIRDARQRYPWTGHFLSQPNAFSPVTPVAGAYNHPFYPKEGPLYALLKSQSHGHDNPMARLDWYFVDDPALQANTLQQQLALETFLYNAWYDFPLQFNADLTDTQGGARMSRRLAQLRERAEGPYLQRHAETDGAVGILGVGGDLFGLTFLSGSYLMPTVLQNGFMPRHVRPEQIADPALKVLFFGEKTPTAATLAALERFVRRGGTLVLLSGAGAWNEHGVPQGAYSPPALVALSGVARRYGLRPKAAVTWAAGAPIRPDAAEFDSEYEVVEPVAPDVVVCGAYPDHVPAVTWRRAGDGRVIQVNCALGRPPGSGAWDHGNVPEHYRYASLLRAIFAESGVAAPLPRFVHTKTDDGPFQLLWLRTYNATRDITYLAAFLDSRAERLDARLLVPPGTRVRELMAVKEMPDTGSGHVPVSFAPGEFRFLAVRADDPQALHAEIAEEGDRDHLLKLSVTAQGGRPWSGQRPLRLRFFDPQGREVPALRRWVSAPLAKPLLHRVALDDVPGRWTVEVLEPVSGRRTTEAFRVRSAHVPPPPPTYAFAGGTAEETLGLLRRLRSVYEAGGGRPSLSYYLHLRGNDSRHAVVRRLERLDWSAAESAILTALRGGERFYLTGEDLGRLPGGGGPTGALFDNRATETVQALLGKADRVVAPPGWPDTLVALYGKGRLFLDRASLDEAFPPGQEFQLGFPDKTASRMGEWVAAWITGLSDGSALASAQVIRRPELQRWIGSWEKR